jgi:hypothetical protein
VLRRKVRANAGRQHAISDAVRQAVLAQYSAQQDRGRHVKTKGAGGFEV